MSKLHVPHRRFCGQATLRVGTMTSWHHISIGWLCVGLRRSKPHPPRVWDLGELGRREGAGIYNAIAIGLCGVPLSAQFSFVEGMCIVPYVQDGTHLGIHATSSPWSFTAPPLLVQQTSWSKLQ